MKEPSQSPLSRRAVLAGLAGSALVGAKPVASRIHCGCRLDAWPVDAAQPKSFFDALMAIEDLGFDGFETDFRNVAPLVKDAAVFKERQGKLVFFGAHMTLGQPAMPAAKVVADLGARYLIVSGTGAGTGEVEKKARALNELGGRVKSMGLELAYRNQAKECAGGAPEIEMLVSLTDPSVVSYVLDRSHAFEVEPDELRFVQRHQNRLAAIQPREGSPLSSMADTLRKAGWSGWVLAEPSARAARPVFETLKQAFA